MNAKITTFRALVKVKPYGLLSKKIFLFRYASKSIFFEQTLTNALHFVV